jgi:signal transduction histidine kinase
LGIEAVLACEHVGVLLAVAVPTEEGDIFIRNTRILRAVGNDTKQMDGTFHATDGPGDATQGRLRIRLRLVSLGVVLMLSSLLFAWVNRSTWQRMERLQKEFAGMKADDFYLGVRMRSGIQQLNDTLLRYRLRRDTNDAEAFRTDAQVFRQLLDSNSTNSLTPVEHEFFDQVTMAYDNYLIESKPVLEANLGRLQSTQARDFKESYEKIQNQSRRLLDLCDSFINNQRSSFAESLNLSSHTLASAEHLLQLSLLVLLTLAAALVFLVYRGMIAPLRHELSESHAVIMRQEKLASLGVLAAGVAHEIRNPLTAIKVRLYSLKKSLPANGGGDEDATVIGNEITRLERIVQDFLQFARPSEPALACVPVRQILTEVQALLEPQLKKLSVELLVQPTDHLMIKADIQQIKQVLINLVQNAADSVTRNGVVTLCAHRGSSSLRRQTKNTVVIDVTDNGKGIPPEVRKRLFDPFFTTKEGGTGLGLPIAARIIEKHGGELRYHTELNRGTTFSIILSQAIEHETQSSTDRR